MSPVDPTAGGCAEETAHAVVPGSWPPSPEATASLPSRGLSRVAPETVPQEKERPRLSWPTNRPGTRNPRREPGTPAVPRPAPEPRHAPSRDSPPLGTRLLQEMPRPAPKPRHSSSETPWPERYAPSRKCPTQRQNHATPPGRPAPRDTPPPGNAPPSARATPRASTLHPPPKPRPQRARLERPPGTRLLSNRGTLSP
ncbi:uncharacterized protein LOC124090415 [Marmota monax]|uniref:uncharacterized protein LOC124090415 n=1 Tax=Marmota monax TaxID=9995 RepID=UPI001EB07289|nr:uncharacterized protein LOC124090415 [Marmota monax]